MDTSHYHTYLKPFVFAMAIAASFFASISLGQQVSQVCAQASINFGDRFCSSSSASLCPFGMIESRLATVGGNYFCIPAASRFCEELTGDPAVLTNTNFTLDADSAFPYCAKPPRPAIGGCDGVNFVFRNKSDAFRSLINSTIEKVDRGNLRDISVDADGIRCNNLGGDTTQPRIVVPRVNNVDKLNDNGNFTQAYAAAQAGFAIVRGHETTRYCPAGSDLLVTSSFNPLPGLSTGILGTNTFACYPGVLEVINKPCLLGILPDESSQRCITGSRQAIGSYPALIQVDGQTTLRVNEFNIDRGLNYISSSAQRVPQDYLNFVDSSRCKITSQEYLQARSNKGCSAYMEVDQNNRVVPGARYSDCVKCIYGDNPVTVSNPVDIVVTGASGSPPGNASILSNPEYEPWAIPIPGNIYTDAAGCIATANTASVVNTALRIALGIMGILVIFRIIQGALIIQKGDPEGFQEGRDIITSALLGLLTLIFAAAILNFLGINVLQLEGFSAVGPNT